MQKVLARHRSGTERACEELRSAWEHVAAQEKLEAETQAGAEERQSVARERSLARAERASSLHESSFQRRAFDQERHGFGQILARSNRVGAFIEKGEAGFFRWGG